MKTETREKIHTTLKNYHFSAWLCTGCAIFLAIPLIISCFTRPELELRYDWLEDVILLVAPIWAVCLVAFFLHKALTIRKAKSIFEASLTEEASLIRFTCAKIKLIKSATKHAQLLGAFLYDEEGNEYLLLLADTVPAYNKTEFAKSLLTTFTAKKYAETRLLCEVDSLPNLTWKDAEEEEDDVQAQ